MFAVSASQITVEDLDIMQATGKFKKFNIRRILGLPEVFGKMQACSTDLLLILIVSYLQDIKEIEVVIVLTNMWEVDCIKQEPVS